MAIAYANKHVLHLYTLGKPCTVTPHSTYYSGAVDTADGGVEVLLCSAEGQHTRAIPTHLLHPGQIVPAQPPVLSFSRGCTHVCVLRIYCFS